MKEIFMIQFSLVLFFTFISPSVLFAQSYSEVVAKKGDGIYTLLREHGFEPASYFKAFLELNENKIGKDSSLFIGKVYRLPLPDTEGLEEEVGETNSDVIPKEVAGPTKEELATEAGEKGENSIITIPLLGKTYERIEIKDQQLKGAVYYLLAGHGGPDPGAICKYGPYMLSEDEYAYDITLRLYRRLVEHGATVYMIIQDATDGIRDGNILVHDADETCYPDKPIPYSQKERLRQRTQAVNSLYLKHKADDKAAYQRMISVHVDSRSKSENIDVFFYHHENSPSGKKLAESIHQTIISKYNRYQPNRDYSGNVFTRSSLYVVKYSHPPTVFIELGNIKNKKDQRRFVLPDNRQALANWLFEGILSDYATAIR